MLKLASVCHALQNTLEITKRKATYFLFWRCSVCGYPFLTVSFDQWEASAGGKG
jgi:rubrerythrin